jgi:hypothetical protein
VLTVKGWAAQLAAGGTGFTFTLTNLQNPPLAGTLVFPEVRTLTSSGAVIDTRSSFATVALLGAGVQMSKSTLSVTEGSSSVTYTVALMAEPSAAVTVTAAADATQVTVAPTSLTFTGVSATELYYYYDRLQLLLPCCHTADADFRSNALTSVNPVSTIALYW